MNRLRIISYSIAVLSVLHLVSCREKNLAKPQVMLKGQSLVTIEKGTAYHDAGAKAVDATGEDLVVKQFGNVDTSRVGSYGITYICEDHLGQRSVAARRVMVIGKNLLADKNPQVFKAGIEQFDAKAYVYDQDSHRADGSGSLKLQAQGKAAFGKSVISPVFRLEKGHHYTIRAYIKMKGDARGQNLLMKVSKKDDYKVFQEVYWNIAEMDEWEQVILPYRAAVSGEYNFRFFLHKHSYSTDDKVVTKEAKNLAKNPIIYFDDFNLDVITYI